MRRALILALLLGACSSPVQPDLFDTADITIGSTDLTVWVGDESAERRQGLRDVEELPDGVDGMLFAWSAPLSATLTMEDTLIPLDIWWIDETGVLVGSTRMEPCSTEPCTNYGSPGPIQWALETPAGEVALVVGSMLSTTGNG